VKLTEVLRALAASDYVDEKLVKSKRPAIKLKEFDNLTERKGKDALNPLLVAPTTE